MDSAQHRRALIRNQLCLLRPRFRQRRGGLQVRRAAVHRQVQEIVRLLPEVMTEMMPNKPGIRALLDTLKADPPDVLIGSIVLSSFDDFADYANVPVLAHFFAQSVSPGFDWRATLKRPGNLESNAAALFDKPVDEDRLSFTERLLFAALSYVFDCVDLLFRASRNSLRRELGLQPLSYSQSRASLDGKWNNTCLYFYNAFPGWPPEPLSSTPNMIQAGPLMTSTRAANATTISSAPVDPTIQWLDQQEDQCVLFVSLGTFHTFTVEEYDHIVQALTRADSPVLFLLRRPLQVRLAASLATMKRLLGGRLMLVEWAPQKLILQHPAVAVFWTHGGQGGLFEAFHAQVPCVCTPYCCDQPMNCLRLQKIGGGVVLPQSSLPNSDAVVETLQQARSEHAQQTFRQHLMRISQMAEEHDGPQKAVGAIQHVLRFGCEHLAPKLHNYSYLEVTALDVRAFFFVACGLLIYVSVKVILTILRRLLSAPRRERGRDRQA